MAKRKSVKNVERVWITKMEPSDIQRLENAQRLLKESESRHALLVEGALHVAKQVREKYQLPDEYDVDVVTGKVYPKVA
jgi:hypothetical protein